MIITPLPDVALAAAAKPALAALHAASAGLFQCLFAEGRPLPAETLAAADLAALEAAGLVRPAHGQVSTDYRITKVQDLFIVTDTPAYFGKDRVWYLLEDESLLFARRIPDCTGLRCLDIGFGSGVLALMAARNGAASVTAIDISPRAGQIARFNAALNGLAGIEFLTMGIEDFAPAQPFDVITFNPPFVPVPDHADYVLSGGGGRDGLALVHAFFAKFDQFAHADSRISLISMSPGDEQISVLERLFLKRGQGKNVTVSVTDVYGSATPIDVAFAPFAAEAHFPQWRAWLAERNYTHLHYLFLTQAPAREFGYRRQNLVPPLEDLPESGTWGAMYRVIQNSKDHA